MNPLQMIMQMMSSGRTPQSFIQEILSKNPNANGILNQIQNSGMNPKEFVEQLARQNNIDLSQFYQFAYKNGIKL